MAGLLEPYIPNVSSLLSDASEGYNLGSAMRKTNLLQGAGQLAAKGDLAGAKSALYAGGDFDEARKVNESIRQATSDNLAKAQRSNQMIGELAMGIKSLPPEEQTVAWGKAINAARSRGINVKGYEDPSMIDFVIAQAGKTGELLKNELERRKLDILQDKTSQPKARNLSLTDIDKLQKKGVQLENVDRYVNTFKDENAGYGRTGETQMWMARNLPILTGPKTEDAANWWQDYDRYKNVVRNELFGSALTTQEKEAFDAADIGPNMDPKLIRQNLARQQEAVKSALRKTTSSLKASGYPSEAVDEATGTTAEQLQPAEPTTGGNNRVRINLGKGTQQPGAAAPREAVDMLRKDPSAAAKREFDEVFGQGAADNVLGR